jgi:hypothetical protein
MVRGVLIPAADSQDLTACELIELETGPIVTPKCEGIQVRVRSGIPPGVP